MKEKNDLEANAEIAKLKKQVRNLEKGIEERKQGIIDLKLTQFTLDNASDAVFWMEADGGFSYVNTEACLSLGYTNQELLKLKLWDIDPIFPKERFQEEWENYRKDEIGSQHIETSHRKKDGTIFPVEIVSKHIWFEDKELHIAFARNISERKKVEKNLRDSEERFRAIFEQAAVGVAQIVTSTGHFNRINKKYLEIIGYSKEEMMKLSFPKITHPDDREESLFHMGKLKCGELLDFSMEKRYIRKDGSIVWVNLSVSPMWAPGEEQIYHIAVVEDITNRKEIEETLRKSEQQLREANATKDKFFSIISHDLRNPFNTILGFSDLLSSNYKDYGDDERIKMVDELNNSAKHAYSLLENLLHWANAQLGRIEINKEIKNIKKIVNKSIDPYLPYAANKRIEVIDNIPADVDLWADVNTFETVIGNIFNNSIKFTPEGGKITLNAYTKKDISKIMISDNGVGMDQNVIDKLFRIDECKSQPGTNSELGTGLGLILCKEFIEKNDGRIEVESELGEGSTFSIILPVKV